MTVDPSAPEIIGLCSLDFAAVRGLFPDHRGDLVSRIAATLNKSLKGHARSMPRPDRPGFFRRVLRAGFRGDLPRNAGGPTMTEDRSNPTEWRPRTRLVHGGQLRSQFGETCEALYLTSGYVYDSAEQAEAAFANRVTRFIYSRYANPTLSMFEERMALIEGAETARATASGMAAVFAALMCQLKAGDRVVSSDALFGSCQYIVAEILPRFGVETVMVDGRDLDQWRQALSKKTAAVFLESPANPSLRIIALAAFSEPAHSAGPRVGVAHVLVTPPPTNRPGS